MKIGIERVGQVGSNFIIYFQDEIVKRTGNTSVHTTPLGAKALRILRMHVDKAQLSISLKDPKQVHMNRRCTDRHIETLSSLQATMDRHANTGLRVASFRGVAVTGGNRHPMKTCADIDNLWSREPGAIVVASRHIQLNMPTHDTDPLRIDEALRGLPCVAYATQRWTTKPSLDVDVLELSLYYDVSHQKIDPWAVMTDLEKKIQTAIQE